MEFMIENDCFNKAISDVYKAITLNSPFPILSGIKVTAKTDCLILIGSNSEIFIEKVIPLIIDGVKVLEIYKTGSVVISAKYLSEIVKKLPAKVHVQVTEKQLVTIESDEIITNLYGTNVEEYPKLPQIDEANCINIPSFELIEMIRQTAFAVSKTESTPVLTGVHMTFQDNHISCVATNSHRLALRKLAIESNIVGSYIIPSKSLMELTKLINPDSEVIQIFVTGSYIVFRTNTLSLFSRLIEGHYPNTSGLFPKDSKTTIILKTNQLLKGIDRACLFASEWKNNNVHLEIKDGKKIVISSKSSEIGTIEECQTITMINGETDLNITLDGNFLIEALKVIKDEEIRISFGGAMRPVLIEPINNPNCLHLISPVRSY